MSILANVVCLFNVLFIWRLWFKADFLSIIAMTDVVAMWQMVKPLGGIYFNLSSGILIRTSSHM